MISYKRDVLETQSLSVIKMDRGSQICERVLKKIVEYFKNNIPQHQIAKALKISSSTVNIIIKRLKRKPGEISRISISWSSGPQMTLHHSSA